MQSTNNTNRVLDQPKAINRYTGTTLFQLSRYRPNELTEFFEPFVLKKVTRTSVHRELKSDQSQVLIAIYFPSIAHGGSVTVDAQWGSRRLTSRVSGARPAVVCIAQPVGGRRAGFVESGKGQRPGSFSTPGFRPDACRLPKSCLWPKAISYRSLGHRPRSWINVTFFWPKAIITRCLRAPRQSQTYCSSNSIPYFFRIDRYSSCQCRRECARDPRRRPPLPTASRGREQPSRDNHVPVV